MFQWFWNNCKSYIQKSNVHVLPYKMNTSGHIKLKLDKKIANDQWSMAIKQCSRDESYACWLQCPTSAKYTRIVRTAPHQQACFAHSTTEHMQQKLHKNYCQPRIYCLLMLAYIIMWHTCRLTRTGSYIGFEELWWISEWVAFSL